MLHLKANLETRGRNWLCTVNTCLWNLFSLESSFIEGYHIGSTPLVCVNIVLKRQIHRQGKCTSKGGEGICSIHYGMRNSLKVSVPAKTNYVWFHWIMVWCPIDLGLSVTNHRTSEQDLSLTKPPPMSIHQVPQFQLILQNLFLLQLTTTLW